MPELKPKLQVPLTADDLPLPIMFRAAQVPKAGTYPLHSHAWGEFVVALSGVMEVEVAGQRWLAPPHYGVWLPPGLAHVGLNRQPGRHASVYVSAQAAGVLPSQPCALTLSALVRAMVTHLAETPESDWDQPLCQRLLACLLDQLALAPPVGSYLPGSDDPALSRVLQALHDAPGDPRSVADWAAWVHLTERTLMRRAQRDLGLPLAQWRLRLKVVKAMAWLQAGQSPQSVAHKLGYQSTSAFLHMYKRHTAAANVLHCSTE